MDTGGFYRNRSSITRGLGSGFPSSQDTVNHSPTGFQHGFGNMHPAQIQISNGLNGGEQSQMEHKLGQIASMVSTTQQLLLSQ